VSFTFALGKDVQIYWYREAAGVDDLQAGQPVRITYETKDDALIATGVYAGGERPARRPPEGGDGERPARRPAPEGADSVSGLLRRVALTDREIIVATPAANGREAYTTLPVAEDARITRDGKELAFDDLKEEESVSVQVAMRNGKNVAVVVAVGVAGPAVANKADPDAPSKIEKVRTVLRIVDAVLRIAQERRNPGR